MTEPVRTRAAVVRIFDRGDTTTIIGSTATLVFTGDSAQLLRAVLELHAAPLTRTALLAALAELSDDVPETRGSIDELVALLEREGVLVAPRGPVAMPYVGRRVVLAISGAIAAVDSPAMIRGLQGLGCTVRVAMTRSARRFVAVAALDALTHHAVWTGLWQRDERVPVPHVNLAEWAELVVVCPASATTLARLATGDCSDLVSALVTATRAPVIVVPSMNDAMYASPAVQDNLERLRTHGRLVVHPALGLEVAHEPDRRRPMLGPAPPAAAVLDIVRHALGQLAPRLPDDAAGWERLWQTTADDRLPWLTDVVDDALAGALARHLGALVDLGTGTGTVAIEAARRGYRVTATELAATALARARTRAGELPILFVLDDITAPRLAGPFDVAVDRGLLHGLPRARWPAYAAAVTALLAPTGTLLLIAHQPGGERGTIAIGPGELAAILPAFDLVSSAPTALSGGAAQLFELRRRP